jgi:hypothetical protein
MPDPPALVGTPAPSGTSWDYIYLGNPEGISAYADRQTDNAQTFLLRLGDAVAGLAPPVITPEFPTGGSAPALSVPALPTFSTAVWTSPAIPTLFTGTLDVSDLTVAPFDEGAPVLLFPTAPLAFSEALPDAPGLNLTFADPTLALNLPTAPDLLAISIAPFAGLNMPTFSATEPTLTLTPPSIREYTPGAPYTSALLTALKTSLQERITTGGTGLNADVENAIWDRGREREARSTRDALDALDQMEALGYSAPPGIYLDARLKVITELDYANRGHSREVMIKSAELELDNVKHALTTAESLESTLINYTNAIEQRLFDSTKYATEAGIAIYNAQVQGFAALVEVYRTKVQVYTAQIAAETAKVDAYRALVQAEEAKAQVNTALVQQYKVSADVALSAIEVYKAEIAGIQTKAEIEKIKVEVFGEQVRAYGARVNAYTAGVEGYRASIEAETAKQQAYRAQVDAFAAQVEASVKQIDARIAVYRGQLDAKNTEWEGYKATVAGESARIAGIVSTNSALAQVYQSQVTGLSSFNEVLTKQWQATLDQNQKVADIAIAAAKANSELYITTRSLALDAAKVGATVSAQLGAAALNAIHWSTSYSDANSVSLSVGTSYSNSTSQSLSESLSTSNNYNYSR